MKLAEFNALCEREWNKPRRGDIESLRLTGPGAAELSRDVLMGYPPLEILLNIKKSDLPAIRAGAAVSNVVNPITRTVVKIKTREGGERETARVRVMGGTYRSTWWPATAGR